MILVFFLYGLMFFILGFAIFIYPKKESAFKLADKLWLLAWFGFIHGINEWLDMFILIKKPAETVFLSRLGLFSLVVSFLFLFQFGVKVIAGAKKKYSILKVLPSVAFMVWVAVVMSSSQRMLLGNIWARYLLGFPAVFLTAYALFTQIAEFKGMKLFSVVRDLKIAIGAFLSYGILAGCLVPDAEFFPASVFNYSAFLGITGIPVQIFRSLCAAVITYAMVRILGVFEWETKTRIRDLLTVTQNAYAELKKLEETKNSLTQMIVHDLNSPLTAIKGNIELLEMEMSNVFSEEQRNNMHTVLFSIQEMKDMISNLLDIGKIEEGKLALRYEEINLDEIFREATDVMHVLARQDGKVLTVHVPSGLPRVKADKEMIRRIISNLMGNAIKFTPSGSTIDIAAYYNSAGREVVIGVKDQGKGIPKEYLHRIFEKFVQVEATQSGQRTGKGLGLTFCKMATEAHGGRIWVESELNKGSTFYFTVPSLNA